LIFRAKIIKEVASAFNNDWQQPAAASLVVAGFPETAEVR
jgi:hypothetical protein